MSNQLFNVKRTGLKVISCLCKLSHNFHENKLPSTIYDYINNILSL